MKNKNLTVRLLPAAPTLIFLAFFFAKIFDKIDWSWWWVFSPLWIPIGIVILLIAFLALIYILVALFSFNSYLWK